MGMSPRFLRPSTEPDSHGSLPGATHLDAALSEQITAVDLALSIGVPASPLPSASAELWTKRGSAGLRRTSCGLMCANRQVSVAIQCVGCTRGRQPLAPLGRVDDAAAALSTPAPRSGREPNPVGLREA
jgi:hypothetical protein